VPVAGVLPLSFVPNLGDWPDEVAYVARGRGGTAFLTRDEAVVSSRGGADVLRLRWEGGAQVTPRPRGQRAGRVHDLRGNRPEAWKTGVPTFAEVDYPEVYPGVDLVFEGHSGELELDLRLAPGADERRLALHIDGAVPSLTSAGDVALTAGERTWVLRRPRATQGGRDLDAAFVVSEGRLGVRLGARDPLAPVFVDPVLAYSTYLGGVGADVVNAVTTDKSGNIYLVGTTTSPNFPTSKPLEAYDGGNDAFVAELNPSADALVFSTFIGGAKDDGAQAVAVDGNGNIYVVGSTDSLNFPTVAPLQPALAGETDAFALKLAPGGASFVYSTYLGSGDDDAANGVAVDATGDAFVTGYAALGTFPSWNSFRTFQGGRADVFVTELSPTGAGFSTGTFSTFVGGTGQDWGYAIALDAVNNVYLTGSTQSATTFPVVAAVQTAADGGQNGFVTELAAGGQSFVFSTYLGGSGVDTLTSLALDGAGDIYVAGRTTSPNLPSSAGVVQPQYAGATDGFVAELAAGGHPLVFLSYLGGNQTDSANAVAVGPDGFIYLAGSTASSNFPVLNALQLTRAGPSDAFIALLGPGAQRIVYSTYFGGSAADEANALALLDGGALLVAGDTASTNFPQAPDAGFQSAYGAKNDGGRDGFLVRIEQPAPSLTNVLPDGGPTGGGTPVTLSGANLLSGAVVTFGGAEAGTTTFVSSGNLTAVSPRHDAGLVDISVLNPDGQRATFPGAFTYWGPAALISPATLTVDAGDPFVLDGAGSTPSPGAAITAFVWGQTAGSEAASFDGGTVQSLTLSEPGSYVFSLVVDDSLGQTSPPAGASVQVLGGGPAVPPYQFGCSCGAGGTTALCALAFLMGALRRRRPSAG
jgi:hypothetical protein